MLPNRLPTQESTTGRGLKTVAQAIIGFVAGLILAIWAVPGVPEVIKTYLQTHLMEVILTVGIPTALSSGVTSFVWNKFFNDKVKKDY